ncbi:deoxyribodipyrimidine photo-lyase [Candidatus Profftia tarda]|uniref:Deoxyribodipyrimidine photo-lyase n=1 Tax=Candidatus Profftia tarda TaxID=1177216 RepID=A0A8E4EZZ4_9ENTR|nr:deoxyribodipyrimidine photo-lyase [Candidatus Profftia tarda]CAD6509478.1 Deoxyribodipyrimidine photo-lyase [Candidatus Profftia tarda]
MSSTNVVWFRNDLRVQDNRALYEACKNPLAKVISVYIATPGQWKKHNMSPRQAKFINQHLQCLVKNLAKKNIPFFYQQSVNFRELAEWLVNFCKQHEATNLFYNKQYALNERRRDDLVAHLIKGVCKIHEFHDAVLLPPGSVLNYSGEMYKVFSSFRKSFLQQLNNLSLCVLPAPDKRNQISNICRLKPFDYPQQEIDHELFPVGEKAALNRLYLFCREHVQDYAQLRDIPSLDGTSMLSPYLSIGILSPRQCLQQLLIKDPNVLENKKNGEFIWLNEFIWRDFYHHLLVAYPKLCRNQPFIQWNNNIPWIGKAEHLIAWQQGKTGYPIIDAAMRQLNYTGWMHNRLRMLTSSFLVKDLLINWRAGESYFMSQLIDGDLAANNGGWQWAASSGIDSAPYFRIFNPTTQAKRFDEQGLFIRRWIPELEHIPKSHINTPHLWDIKASSLLDYPQPIVDHLVSRKKILILLKESKSIQSIVL